MEVVDQLMVDTYWEDYFLKDPTSILTWADDVGLGEYVEEILKYVDEIETVEYESDILKNYRQHGMSKNDVLKILFIDDEDFIYEKICEAAVKEEVDLINQFNGRDM